MEHAGAVAFCGLLNYAERQRVMDSFMANEIKILVATDVLCRGAFGSSNIVMVINFEPPVGENNQMCMKNYNLRCARAGQFGREAVIVDFMRVTMKPADSSLDQHYRNYVKTVITV